MTGTAHRRDLVLFVGQQRSGKTYQLCRRAWASARKPGRAGVLVIDRTGEIAHGERPPGSVAVSSWAEYQAIVENNECVPGAVVFAQGADAAQYAPVVEEAIWRGDSCVVVDEAWVFAPSRGAWPVPRLVEVVLSGRHLPRGADGELRPCSLLTATQYPRDLHHSIYDQATEVWCGQVRGELAYSWVRGSFGAAECRRVEALREHRFIRLA